MTNFVIGKIKIPQCLCKTVENMRKWLIFGQQDFERACHVRVENKSEQYIYWQDMEIFMGSAWGGGEGSSKIHKHLSMIWNIMKKEIFWCFDNCNKKKTECLSYLLEQRICRQKILWKEDPVVKVMMCIVVVFVCGRCPMPICPPVCVERAVWTVGYGERSCWGLETTKGDIKEARRCNAMEKNKQSIHGG